MYSGGMRAYLLALVILVSGALTPDSLAQWRSRSSSVTGTWKITLKSRNRTWTETVRLRQDRDRVRGMMTVADGTSGKLVGEYVNGVLRLERDTGLATIQKFELQGRGSRFSGRYWNEGSVPDNGTVELTLVSDADPFEGEPNWDTGVSGQDWSNEAVSGTWRLTMRRRNSISSENVDLQQEGDVVWGTTTTADGSVVELRGSYDGSTLRLARNTGSRTVQDFEFTRRGRDFQGRYWNSGRRSEEGEATLELISSNEVGDHSAGRDVFLTGTWYITLRGENETWRETLTLNQRGDRITGKMSTSDGTRGGVSGTYDGTTLQLERDTGRDTIQRFQMRPYGAVFRGRFWNQGKWEDQGRVEMRRERPPIR
jgi:hypothetical protein